MKKILSVIVALALASSAALFTGCNSVLEGVSSNAAPTSAGAASAKNFVATADLSGKLALNGSTSMAKVCQALGEAFSEKYPKVTVEKAEPGPAMRQKR